MLYIDPPLSPLSLIRHPERLTDLRGRRVSDIDARLSVWRPVVVPGQNSRIGQFVNGLILERGIRRLIWPPELTLAFSLEARALLGRAPGRRIYHCTDSFEDLPGADAADVRRRERAVIAASDAVSACSRPLVEQLGRQGTAAVYVPHGCDPGAVAAPPTPPPGLRDRPRPWVGYVGSLNFRLDSSLLEAARRANAGGTLVLVGGRFAAAPDPATERLLALSDVVSVPQQPPGAVPGIMASLDAGIVPYSIHPFNRKSFPIKIMQYLAAGVPVVSTPNGATDELGDHVLVAEDPRSFGAAVGRVLERPSQDQKDARRAVAMARPWTRVAAELVEAAGVAL